MSDVEGGSSAAPTMALALAEMVATLQSIRAQGVSSESLRLVNWQWDGADAVGIGAGTRADSLLTFFLCPPLHQHAREAATSCAASSRHCIEGRESCFLDWDSLAPR